MATRLWAVPLVFAMIGSPVVTTACQAACAARESTSAMMGEHHSCHHEASPSEAPAVTSTAHACGHSEEGPTALDQSLQTLPAPAVVVAAFVVSRPALDAQHRGFVRVAPSTPDSLALKTQLRI